MVPEPLLMGPFALQHEPDAHASHLVLAGHVHPVYRLRGKGRQSLRLPCFLLGTQRQPVAGVWRIYGRIRSRAGR